MWVSGGNGECFPGSPGAPLLREAMGSGGVVMVAVLWTEETTAPQLLEVTGGRPKLCLQLGKKIRGGDLPVLQRLEMWGQALLLARRLLL